MFVEKEATMKSLHAFQAPVTCADVLKGRYDKKDKDNMLNMTEESQ